MTGHPAIWYVSGLASGYVIGVACCAVLLCIVLRRGLR